MLAPVARACLVLMSSPKKPEQITLIQDHESYLLLAVLKRHFKNQVFRMRKQLAPRGCPIMGARRLAHVCHRRCSRPPTETLLVSSHHLLAEASSSHGSTKHTHLTHKSRPLPAAPKHTRSTCLREFRGSRRTKQSIGMSKLK